MIKGPINFWQIITTYLQARYDVIIKGTVATSAKLIFQAQNSAGTVVLSVRGDNTIAMCGAPHGYNCATRGISALYSDTAEGSGTLWGFRIVNARNTDGLVIGYSDNNYATGIWNWVLDEHPLIIIPAGHRLRIGTGTSATNFLEISGTPISIGGGRQPSYGIDMPSARFGTTSNYALLDTDGTLTLAGNATVWDDLLIPVTATKLGGLHDPGFAKFKDNGAGSTGVFLYWFDPDAEEELFFQTQMRHNWKEGSTIYPHVYWTPEATSDGTPANQAVKWGLEYTWANQAATFNNTSLIYGEVHDPADADVVASKHYVNAINDTTGIVGTGMTISSTLVGRIFRAATAAEDTYEHDAGLLGINLHYEIDSLGSKTVSSK